MAYLPHKAPTGPERAELAHRLKERIDKTAAKLKDVPEAELDELIDEAVDRVRLVLSDPDGDPVVYTAVDGQADVLCTLDRDLFQPSVVTFCREKHIAVMTDVELPRILVPRVPAVE